MNIKENIGIIDRLVRILAGIFFVVAYFHGLTHGILGISLLAVTWIFFATAIFGFSPTYNLLGIHTNRRNKSEKTQPGRNDNLIPEARQKVA